MLTSGINQRPAVSRRRSTVEIIADMLRIGENGAGKTRIMYSANMSFSQIQRYLDFLVCHDFIEKADMGSPTTTYRVTENGLKLLRLIDSLTDMLGLNEVERL